MGMIVMAVIIVMIIVMIIMAVIIVMIIMAVIVVMIIMAVIVVMIIVAVIVVMIMDMHFSVKVLSFSPNQRRSDSSLDRERATIAQTPLKNATKQTIDGVMPWVIIEVVVKSTMALDGDNGSEVEFTGFKGFTRSTMGAVGESGRTCCKGKS